MGYFSEKLPARNLRCKETVWRDAEGDLRTERIVVSRSSSEMEDTSSGGFEYARLRTASSLSRRLARSFAWISGAFWEEAQSESRRVSYKE